MAREELDEVGVSEVEQSSEEVLGDKESEEVELGEIDTQETILEDDEGSKVSGTENATETILGASEGEVENGEEKYGLEELEGLDFEDIGLENISLDEYIQEETERLNGSTKEIELDPGVTVDSDEREFEEVVKEEFEPLLEEPETNQEDILIGETDLPEIESYTEEELVLPNNENSSYTEEEDTQEPVSKAMKELMSQRVETESDEDRDEKERYKKDKSVAEKLLERLEGTLSDILPLKEGQKLEKEINQKSDKLKSKMRERVREKQKEEERIDKESMKVRSEYANMTKKQKKRKKRRGKK